MQARKLTLPYSYQMHADLDDLDGALTDGFGRPLHDLRISVTDRCNFRCSYCMPREVFGPDFPFLRRDGILTIDEIARLAWLFAERGVQKLRLTGGEPTLRADLPALVAMLREIPSVEIAMTTNGTLLKSLARPLADAGLHRVTVSLDALDDPTFRAMNDTDFPVTLVIEGIEAAQRAGLGPVKVNAVVRRGLNEHAVLDLARYFRGTSHVVRFIEFMDVGTTNHWQLDEVVPASELVGMLDAEFPLEPVEASYLGEVARRYRYLDGAGEVGFITSVTQPFCGACSRARLSADGTLYTCLFAGTGTDLRGPLRAGASDADLGTMIDGIWRARRDRYSELRDDESVTANRIEMSYIGG